jgi:hypothetical protein
MANSDLAELRLSSARRFTARIYRFIARASAQFRINYTFAGAGARTTAKYD